MKTTSQQPWSTKVVGSLPAQACGVWRDCVREHVCVCVKPILGSAESLRAKSLILQSHNLISNVRNFNLQRWKTC